MRILPNWEQLPSLDLYLDQVLLYIKEETKDYLGTSEKPLTASMINNYVKHGYLPKPEKKKYSRPQVARLIVLTICKTVFAISDIADMIELHVQAGDSQHLYDTFVACLAGKEQADTPPLISKVCQTIIAYRETMELVREIKEED